MQTAAQHPTRLSHILLVCLLAVGSLALMVAPPLDTAADTRTITVQRPALPLGMAIGMAQPTPQQAAQSGQPAPEAGKIAVTTPTLAPTSRAIASTPLAEATLHQVQAAAQRPIAFVATATPLPTATSQPTAPAATHIAQIKLTPPAHPATATMPPPLAATATPHPKARPTNTPIARPPLPKPTSVPQPTAPPTVVAQAAPADAATAQARTNIIGLLAQREQAVRNIDSDNFINTVDPNAGTLQMEQTIWFDDLRSHPTTYYALELGSLTLDPGGNRAIGVMTERAQLAGQALRQVSAQAVFVKRDGQWYYADLDFQTLATDHFRIHFFAANRNVGTAMYNSAAHTYAQITADLGAAPAGVMEVKLYPSEDLLQDSVMLSLPSWVGGWSMPGQSIKTAYNGAPASSYVNLMAHEFTHQVEGVLGLNRANSPDWLNEGLAVYEAERISPDSYEVGSRAAILRKAEADNSFFAWASFPLFQQVTGGQVSLAYEQAYSGVQYLIEKYGMGKFNAMLGYLVAGNGLDEAFTQAFRVSLAQFDSDWRAWLTTKYK